jgi:N-acetyl-alpha-D-muramate 1-phosphate uridylyltransferase
MKRKSDLQVVILAGGLGTRLRPITEKVPKPMVPVAGKPFLHWQLLDLREQGFRRVLLLVAYLGEQVEKHFGDGRDLGLEISYSYEPEPLGTGGSLKNAMAQLDDEFILLNGDSFLRAPLASMVERFHSGEFMAMVSVYDNRQPVPVIPNLKVKDGRVLAYQKDAGHDFDLIDSGIYIVHRQLLEGRAESKFMLADLWPPLIQQGQMAGFLVTERFYDIGTVERLKEFEEKVRDYFPNSFTR